MEYDIIENINKTKENISLFEMYNLPQQRKNLLKLLINNQVDPMMIFNQIKKSMKLALEESLNLKPYHFYYLLRFSIIMYIIVW